MTAKRSQGKGPRGAKPKTPPPGVAFFDFDNTLIHGDAGPLFGRSLFSAQLHAHGLWGRVKLRARYAPYIASMGLQAGLYKLKARRRSSLVRSAYRGLKGVETAELDPLMAAFVDREISDLVFPEMREIVIQHQAAGRRCVIITTGMEGLIGRAARHIAPGIEVIGCHLLDRKGKLTGKVVGPLFGVDKANIIGAYCRALGVDPKACWAYSDHMSDKHMLEAVGHGVAVNPKGTFRKLAKQNRWDILDLPVPTAN
ncbi:MAG: HAD-IB family phosphatase [Candidatus Thermoplasmatota archaeon]|jgi:HAD superfamily hydrolase (TIGR01490 family)